MILEGTQLVNNDHVKIKRHSAAFNEPLHILTVDDVEVCLLPECRKPLFTAAQHQTVIQPLKVIPLGDLGSPAILAYTNRGDDQYLAYLKLVKHEVVQCCQGDARGDANLESLSQFGLEAETRLHEVGFASNRASAMAR